MLLLVMGFVAVGLVAAVLYLDDQRRALACDVDALQAEVRDQGEWVPGLTKRTVAVVTAEGTLRGVLLAVYPDVLVLAHAQLLGTPPTSLHGEVVVPRGQVRFLQDLPPEPVADAVESRPADPADGVSS